MFIKAEQCKPVFRWAGSKRKLLPTLIRYVPEKCRYIEPFAGSACLFFAAKPERAILGDLNAELIRTYRSIRDRHSVIANILGKMPATPEYYYQLRAVEPGSLAPADRAARFIYLNRFCFNGVYRTNRKGLFNVPRGTKTGTLPTVKDLEKWALLFRSVQFKTGDFTSCLDGVRTGDFVYLDPPYTKKGVRNRGEYGYNSFKEADLVRLADALRAIDRIGACFLLSYRYSHSVVARFSNWNRRVLSVRRHVAGFVSARTNVREVLFSNFQL